MAYKILGNDCYKIITKFVQNYIDSILMIPVANQDRNCGNQWPELLLVRVWKGVEKFAFDCKTNLKKRKENLGTVDYTYYFHGSESGVA
jgi:hypothetical protein